jgi:hypothetical protein
MTGHLLSLLMKRQVSIDQGNVPVLTIYAFINRDYILEYYKLLELGKINPIDQTYSRRGIAIFGETCAL